MKDNKKSTSQFSIPRSALQQFRYSLLEWYSASDRPLPWKGKKDPYLIWLSEIILQQTRVEQGLPYYQKFVENYPTVHDLAQAPEDDVIKLWEGLGYYSRARNMHAAAKFIVSEYGGNFPDTYREILNLKGVGPYTAAAIASFAFDLPYAVVDGNVYRVLSRYFDIEEPIDTTAGKKLFSQLASQLIDTEKPATYNQAIMDFGATHCTPKAPACATCLLQPGCVAYNNSKVRQLPVKSKKIVKKVRYFHYLITDYEGYVAIHKRQQKDIWQGLYEFPMLELDHSTRNFEELNSTKAWAELIQEKDLTLKKISPPYQQVLTHQKIIAVFYELEAKSAVENYYESVTVTDRKNLNTFAFPKLIDCYLKDKFLYLNL